MTEPAEALRALIDHPPSTPPPVEELRQRVDGRRRRRTMRRTALAGLATIAGAVAIVPLLDSRSDRSRRVIAGPASSPTTVAAAAPSLEFQAPEGWTTLSTSGPTMVLATRPLSEGDRALALLARDDVAFRSFPPDGVVLVVGYDPVQAKYGFDRFTNTPLDPGPAYGLGAERALAGGVRVRRGEIPQSVLRIASYAGPSAPAARLREAEAIAATVRVIPAANASARSNPPPPGSRPGLPGGPLPVPEEEMSEVARATTAGRPMALVAARDCAYLRPADIDPGTQVSQVVAGWCGSRPGGTAVETAGGAVLLMGGPGTTDSTGVIFRAGPQVRSVTARLVDGRSVAAVIGVDGWGVAVDNGRIVALTGVDTSGRPLPEILVR